MSASAQPLASQQLQQLLIIVLLSAAFAQPQFESLRAISRDVAGADIRLMSLPSVAACASRCLVWPGCLSLEFSASDRVCSLSDQLDGGFPSPAAADAVAFRRTVDCLVTKTVHGNKFCVVQQRLSGRISFARSWAVYENGFGNPDNHWMGLSRIHQLTGSGLLGRLLRFELNCGIRGIECAAEYSDFAVSGPETKYTISFASYLSNVSNCGDSLTFNLGMKFSTMDADNDLSGVSCSTSRGRAGWWFSSCTRANLNGYYCGNDSAAMGFRIMYWWDLASGYDCINETRIMIEM